MLAFWGAWKARPQNSPEGKTSVRTVGLRAPPGEAAVPSSCRGRRPEDGGRPEIGLTRDLDPSNASGVDKNALGAAPVSSPPRLPLTLLFPPQPYQQRAADPTCQALRPQPTSSRACTRRTRLPPQRPRLRTHTASAHKVLHKVQLRHGGWSAAQRGHVRGPPRGLERCRAARAPHAVRTRPKAASCLWAVNL